MRILSMTATFGQLSHRTLTLKPGLNIIEAPNEWGKSTWCAFLAAMLYGIDTSQRTTQTALSDKEHYAPWSGQPMSGRLELSWQGKNITIERSSTKRVPMGEFKAYETDSGLPVPELTADSCGQVLLGVERSVFLRAGFIRQTDMPVTQDDALRRRLNALVTTGDESDAGDQLAEKLKKLKNSCISKNNTGALPQARAKQATLVSSLARLATLRGQLAQINQRQAELQAQLDALKNHRQNLAYERSMEGIYRLNLAREAHKAAQERLQQLEAQTASLPQPQELSEQLEKLRQLMTEKAALEAQPLPDQTYCHELFGDLPPELALEQTKSHKATWDQLKPPGPLLLILAGLCLAAGIGLSLLWVLAWFPALVVAAALAGIHFQKARSRARVRKLLSAPYGALPPSAWVPLAEEYVRQDAAAKAVHEAHWQRLTVLKQLIRVQAGDHSPADTASKWQGWLELYDELEKTRQSGRQAALRVADLEASVKLVAPTGQQDSLTLTEEETEKEIERISPQLQQLQLQAGQCLGQIEALGQEETLRQQLDQVEVRIAKLSDLYEATVLALSHLEQATVQLQQRFAPQLTAKAKELFAALTGGRYDRLILDQQLQLQAGAESEDQLRTARWRSDGTMDQLYLALRLAVAQQLTPSAPLVLDDALVRFDNTRHDAAMALLLQQAEEKQILLFTCQSREGAYSPESVIEI